MNSLLRLWSNLTMPSPRSVAMNHVGADYLLGNTRAQSWKLRQQEMAEMRQRGVWEPWLKRYQFECQAAIVRLIPS